MIEFEVIDLCPFITCNNKKIWYSTCVGIRKRLMKFWFCRVCFSSCVWFAGSVLQAAAPGALCSVSHGLWCGSAGWGGDTGECTDSKQKYNVNFAALNIHGFMWLVIFAAIKFGYFGFGYFLMLWYRGQNVYLPFNFAK